MKTPTSADEISQPIEPIEPHKPHKPLKPQKPLQLLTPNYLAILTVYGVENHPPVANVGSVKPTLIFKVKV